MFTVTTELYTGRWLSLNLPRDVLLTQRNLFINQRNLKSRHLQMVRYKGYVHSYDRNADGFPAPTFVRDRLPWEEVSTRRNSQPEQH